MLVRFYNIGDHDPMSLYSLTVGIRCHSVTTVCHKNINVYRSCCFFVVADPPISDHARELQNTSGICRTFPYVKHSKTSKALEVTGHLQKTPVNGRQLLPKYFPFAEFLECPPADQPVPVSIPTALNQKTLFAPLLLGTQYGGG